MHYHAQISSQNINSSEDIKICRFCKNRNITKRGQRKTQNRGFVQRYFCKICNKRFVLDDGFLKKKNNSDKITQAIHLYFSGASLRKSQEHLGVFHPHNASHMTILRWIREYASLVGNYVDNLKVNNSDSISFDEMEYKTKGKQSFFIDVIDMDTRYMLSSGYYRNRGMEELREVLKGARNKSLNKTTKFYTDGLMAYPQALRKEYSFNKHRKEFLHKITRSTDKAFNWKIERLHNNIRERTKIMRQFKSVASAKDIMKGYEIYYNFCRKHQALGKYPYEVAIPSLQLGKNKWLDLIRLSSKK